MGLPDRRGWEEVFAPQRQPAPAAPEAANEDDERPDFSKAYRAFGHPRPQPLRSMFLYFNADERKRYGRKKIQIQYEHLDSDDPMSEGFADDGQSFAIVVSGARQMLRITVRGRQLEGDYDLISQHRMAWMRSIDRGRDFGQADGPVITSIEIEPIKEEEAPGEGREKVEAMPVQRNRMMA
jgi:hypothetical protein